MEIEKVAVKTKYIIFSFDGGGARMVLQYRMLQRLLNKFPKLLKSVDLFAGTSAGSILAAGLATGKLPGDGTLVQKGNVERIFGTFSLCRKISSLNGLVKCKYENSDLEKLLEDHFGELKFSEIKNKLFIPSFCTNPKGDITDEKQEDNRPSWTSARVKRWHPVYHTNVGTNVDVSVKQAILESTAAPTYFPLVNYHIDGGIGNNNPALSALSKVISIGVDIKDIYILSFGSGERPKSYDTKPNAEPGVVQFLPEIIDMLFDAEQEVVSNNLYQILGDNFWRIQPVLEEEIDLDDASKYETLIRAADKFNLKNTFIWLAGLGIF